MKKLAMSVYVKASVLTGKAMRLLRDQNGQFVMEHATVFAIILAAAAIAIALLTNFMQTDMAPSLSSKVQSFFN